MTKGCWKPAKEKYGVAISCFHSGASSVPSALHLEIGDTVQILEEFWVDEGFEQTATWLRGCTVSNKNKKGIFPACYISRKECTVENEGPYETVTPVEDAIIKELTYVLREWNEQWKSLFVHLPQSQQRKSLFQTVTLVMGELAKCRCKLVSNTLTKEQALALKHQVVTMIDWGNGQLGMDLVPRVQYRQADPDKVSVVEMFRIHERSVKNCQGAWPGGMVKVKVHEEQREVVHHLVISLLSFACSVTDNAEVIMHLYDSSEGKMLSERAVMFFNASGQRASTDKNNNVLFTDLSSEDLKKEIYLVVQIFRKGRLNLEGSFKKVATFQYRRPWGVSVLNLRDMFQIRPENELEYFLRVQCVDTADFYNMHENLIKRQTQLIGKSAVADKQNLQGLTLSVKILDGDIRSVKVENPILFNKGLIITQRMGFPDFINPGESRNDLYLTLCSAEFERGNKTAHKNVEVRVNVYNQRYEPIEACILSANGEPMSTNFLSYVLYHNNSPKWNETIRLSIPNEKFNTSHIRLEISHCSNRDRAEKKLYGFAFLSVTLNNTITRFDGKYDLCIYKVEDSAKIKNYLNFPCQRDDFNDPKVMPSIPDNLPFAHSNKEFITVETFLVSSKFTQKAELINVFQWTSSPERIIPQNLENLCNLRGQELVRYMQSLLDALFGMLNSKNGERVPYAMNIFHTLVHLFNLVQLEMFEKFSVVMEDYLENTFASPVAYRELLYCLQKQAEKIYTCTDFGERASKNMFKVLVDIFKFAVRSCMLALRVFGNQHITEFRDNLNKVFDAFGRILQGSGEELADAQSELLMHLHQSYIPLMHVISAQDLAQLILYICSRVAKEPQNSVLKAKTTFIRNAVLSMLMHDPDARAMLLPMVVGHLKKNMYYQRHLALTANTLGDLLSCIFTVKQTDDVTEEVTKIIQGLFDRVVRTLLVIDDNQRAEAGSLLVSSLTEMLRLMDESHYKKLMNGYPKPKPLRRRLSLAAGLLNAAACKDFLLRVVVVFQELIKKNDFPSDWTSMRMITNNVMLTAIQYIADDLTGNFNGDDFDIELWENFFLMAVDFITQPALQLEGYSEAKRSQIKDKYQDMRVPVGFHIQSLWNHLGPNKQHLMLDMIGPFLRVTMIPQAELRKATIPIFFDIMECEYKIKNHLRRVEGRMIQELDALVIDHNGDAEYKSLFCKVLLDKVEAEPELQEEGKRFVFSITDLLERLLDYRETMDREEQRDAKMHCTFNILNFYKDSRRDMYIRYISRLYDLHLMANNFVEAGLTLRLYANLLAWSAIALPVEMSYPSQTEARRKEELFNRILDCFDKGKAWEYGLPLCKELGEHYESTFQYKKLGHILRLHATFLDRILEGRKLRQDPSYYRVAYYGKTFPPYVKNKSFIYRGDECLKLTTLMNQLTTEYPTATIMTSNQPPPESYKHGDAQYIQIVSVKPVSRERSEFIGREVPTEIAAFYQTNEVDTFMFDRPYHRGVMDKNNEFKSLCLERTVMTSSYKLPGILRWYEVSSSEISRLVPVQTAMETVHMMNKELKTSSSNAATDPGECRHLSMRLQGTIQSLVNGGIKKYQEAFFNDEYVAEYPEEVTYIEQLKLVIFDMLELLNNGLTLHGKLAGPELQPLHHNLVDMFNKMKSSMGYHGAKSRNRDSELSMESHDNSTPSSQSFNDGSNRSSIASASELIATTDEPDDNIYIVAPETQGYPPLLSPHLGEVSNASRRCSSLRSLPSPAGLQPSRPLSAHIIPSHSGPNLRHLVAHHPSSKLAVPMFQLKPAATESSNNGEPLDPPVLPPRKKSIGGGSMSGDVPGSAPPPIPARKQSYKDGSDHAKAAIKQPDTPSSASPVQSKEKNSVPEVPPQLPSKRVTMAPMVKQDLAGSTSAMYNNSGTFNFSRSTSVMSNSSVGSNSSSGSPRQLPPVPDVLDPNSPPPLPKPRPSRSPSQPPLISPRSPAIPPKPSFSQHVNASTRPPPPPPQSSQSPAYTRPPPPSPHSPQSPVPQDYAIPVASDASTPPTAAPVPPPIPLRKPPLGPKPS
ncbi:hypothetical protein RRG08_001856 [Elysia crispata]|uniref:Dedicator of cytokinesis protein 3 n=1 Tax=Elysia crispata TaxID=231223 RepID=A0AAE1DSK0_9GAST|nr:hypothetical protein RRG08_001856 [Elysia crispata]